MGWSHIYATLSNKNKYFFLDKFLRPCGPTLPKKFLSVLARKVRVEATRPQSILLGSLGVFKTSTLKNLWHSGSYRYNYHALML